MPEQEPAPEIIETEPLKAKPLGVRYRWGLTLLLEVGVFAALPFMFLLAGLVLPFGPVYWVAAVGCLVAAPVWAYDAFAKSTQRKIRDWSD